MGFALRGMAPAAAGVMWWACSYLMFIFEKEATCVHIRFLKRSRAIGIETLTNDSGSK